MKDLEKRILEIINEENEEDTSLNNSTENTPEEKSEDTSKEDTENKNSEEDNKENEDDEEEFSAESFEDFLEKTETKVKLTKVSYEPSLIFGPNDKSNHNKYKVTITNEKGTVWFYFWDSIYNTENHLTPTVEDALAAFGTDVGAVLDNVSMHEFAENLGYDETDSKTLRKAYDGCLKMLERSKKLFDESQIKELNRLALEY